MFESFWRFQTTVHQFDFYLSRETTLLSTLKYKTLLPVIKFTISNGNTTLLIKLEEQLSSLIIWAYHVTF